MKGLVLYFLNKYTVFLFSSLVWDTFIYFTLVPDWYLHASLRHIFLKQLYEQQKYCTDHMNRFLFPHKIFFWASSCSCSTLHFQHWHSSHHQKSLPSIGLEYHSTGIFHMNFRLKDLCPNLIQQIMLVKIYYKRRQECLQIALPHYSDIFILGRKWRSPRKLLESFLII